MEQKITLGVLKNIGGFLAMAIPVVQFGFKWFPGQISGLFIKQEMLFFTTLMAFLFSIFAIYLSLLENYLTIGKLYINISNLSNWIPIIIFISTIGFIAIGITQQNGAPIYTILQSVCYILIIALSVLFLAVKTIKIAEKKKADETKKQRPRKAINLAIENDAFATMSRIYFIKAYEKDRDYMVEVKLGEAKYKIVTDDEAEQLKEVELIT